MITALSGFLFIMKYNLIIEDTIMNRKKIPILISVMPLLLGCSKNPYVGKYVFQMGKSKDVHMGITLDLTKTDYEADPSKGRNFQMVLDFDMGIVDSGSSSESGYDVQSILKELLGDDKSVTGYYFVDKNEPKLYDQTRLHLCFDLLEKYDISSDLTDLVFVTTISQKEVNFYIPVSVTDLGYQLYWYMVEEKPVGSHPTAEDVERIRAEHPNSNFRDFHVLQLGLTKQ